MIKRFIKFLLVVAIIIPFGVNASKKIVEIEDLQVDGFLEYAGRKKTGYSDFVLVDRDYETQNHVYYNFDWNKDKTLLSDFNTDILQPDNNHYPYLQRPSGSVSANTTGILVMEQDPSNSGRYRYYSMFNNFPTIGTDKYIYSSSSKGESVGYIFDNRELAVYELMKISGGADYVTETGKIVFSTQSNNDVGYSIISTNSSIITFKNNTNVCVYYYVDDNKGSYLLEKIPNEKLENLLKTDDLEGISLTTNIQSTEEDYYFEVTFDSKTYFINSDATKVLFERELKTDEICVYYGIKYKNNDYIFADVYDIYKEIQISTEAFDLDGNGYFEDSEWLNLYFTGYDALYGVKKINNKYYAIFMHDDGTEIYRKDITDVKVGTSYSNFFGEILTSDHDTNTINDGKYLIQFINKSYDENYFSKYEIMTILSSYNIIESISNNYILGSNKNVIFKINANNELFDKLYINGEELDSSNYTITKGSTVITILSSYLNTLESGTYELKATFTNDEVVTTKIIVNKDTINPKTDDEIITSILIGSICIIGLLGIKLYLKNKRYI